jgi:FkbM family methyltransferase
MMSLLPRPLRMALRRKADPLGLLRQLAPDTLELTRLVHVGAHLAQERGHYEALGYRKILWIEGSPAVHARLAESLAHDAAAGATKAQHLSACALCTDREGEAIALREFSNDGMSSSIFGASATLRERWPELKETGRSEEVPSRQLDALLAELRFGTVDVLVVDVQGAEALVLQGATAVLAEVKAVVSEVSTQPLYEGGVLFAELSDLLAGHGFVPMSVPRRHGDMLFVHPQRAGFSP